MLKFNNIEVKDVLLNGNPINEYKFNGVTVWQRNIEYHQLIRNPQMNNADLYCTIYNGQLTITDDYALMEYKPDTLGGTVWCINRRGFDFTPYYSHKILTLLDAKRTSGYNVKTSYYVGEFPTIFNFTKLNEWERGYKFDTFPKYNGQLSVYCQTFLNRQDQLYIKNFQMFDLTLMFGEGNEPTTIEDFLRRIGVKTIEDIPIIECTEV